MSIVSWLWPRKVVPLPNGGLAVPAEMNDAQGRMDAAYAAYMESMQNEKAARISDEVARETEAWIRVPVRTYRLGERQIQYSRGGDPLGTYHTTWEEYHLYDQMDVGDLWNPRWWPVDGRMNEGDLYGGV